MAITTFAAIDVGSFDLQLAIYEISQKNGIRCLDHMRKTAGVGTDTYMEGKISSHLIDAMCTILKGFCRVMEEYQVKDCRAYATSALREAGNSQIVLDQIRVRTGIEVKVLSNSEQRFLCYKAIAVKENEFQSIIKKGTAIVDVGSGSTQLSLFDKDALVTTQYLKLGALRIKETLGHLDYDRVNYRTLIRELVDSDIDTFRKMFLKDRDIKNIIATGLCALYLNRKGGGDRQADKMTVREFMDFYHRIEKMSPEKLSLEMDIPIEHAYLMQPSVMIFRKMIEITGAELLWIPGVNLCDGIVAEYGEEKRLISFTHDFTEDILVAARNISKRYQGNKKHNQSLEKLVLDIFDSMKKYHGLGQRERLLLQLSVILHDCGKYISMREPAESSYHIIKATEIIGISHIEREIVAYIVKYNTTTYEYEKIMNEVRNHKISNVIAKLVAIMRVGNALDKSHKQKFDHVKITLKDRQLLIVTETSEDISLEQSTFEKRSYFFEEVFGIKPVLKRKRGV